MLKDINNAGIHPLHNVVGIARTTPPTLVLGHVVTFVGLGHTDLKVVDGNGDTHVVISKQSMILPPAKNKSYWHSVNMIKDIRRTKMKSVDTYLINLGQGKYDYGRLVKQDASGFTFLTLSHGLIIKQSTLDTEKVNDGLFSVDEDLDQKVAAYERLQAEESTQSRSGDTEEDH